MIKGQNLRLIVGGRCVAAATECSVRVSAQVENRSTKDTPDGWDRNEVVGNSWDASVGALVIIPEPVAQGKLTALQDVTLPQGQAQIHCWLCDDLISIPKGCTLTVTSESTIYLVVDEEIIDEQTGGTLVFEAAEDTDVQIALENENDTAEYIVPDTTAVTSEDIISYLGGGQVSVRLSLTSGPMNRDEEQALVSGQAYVSDVEITAQDRQAVTCSTRLTGNGPLEPEQEPEEE